MGLKNFRLPTAAVALPPNADGKPNSFEVRGLSLADLSPLIREHGTALTMLFGKGQEMATDNPEFQLDPEDLTNLGMLALHEAPQLIAAIIATATVEGDATDAEKMSAAIMLPLPIQFDAIQNIFTLTLGTEGSVGKMVETVIGLLTGLEKNLTLVTKTPDRS